MNALHRVRPAAVTGDGRSSLRPMRVLVAGSHGLIGIAFVDALVASGHHVTRLVHGSAGPDEVSWRPGHGIIDASGLEGHDAVVNLAEVGIGDHRWTKSQKRTARRTRLRATSLLAETLAAAAWRPQVLVSASAVGFYGFDRGDEELTEASSAGTGFLSELVQEWEQATAPAAGAGIRVALLRSGAVLSSRGGVLARQLPAFRLGLGGRLGTGRQYVSWISLDDELAAIQHVLEDESLQGPVNLTAPAPVTNAEYTTTLGGVLGRPTVLPTPTPALYALFGREMTAEMLLGGQRVVPGTLLAAGFTFAHADVESALRHALER